jgi:hypothetical protein
MNLHSDYPFWLIKEGVLGHFPSLSRDLSTDVLIIGGGISGALIGHKLVQHGIATAIVDKRHIGFGSTSASTALLQYEIDTPLHKLCALVGDRHAARAYHLCEEAIDELAARCDKLSDRAEFERHPSLWYASYKKDMAGLLEPEFRARKRQGFRVRLLGEQDVREAFGFSAPGAILSAVGATCHPYKLTSSLMNTITRQGGVVHDLTEIAGWSATRNQVVLEYEAWSANQSQVRCGRRRLRVTGLPAEERNPIPFDICHRQQADPEANFVVPEQPALGNQVAVPVPAYHRRRTRSGRREG